MTKETLEGLTIDVQGGVVHVRGEIDLANAPLLDRRLQEQPCPVLLDLGDVGYLDAGAVRVLLRQRDRCIREGQPLRAIRWSKPVQRVLTLCGITDMLAITPDNH